MARGSLPRVQDRSVMMATDPYPARSLNMGVTLPLLRSVCFHGIGGDKFSTVYKNLLCRIRHI